MERFKIAAIVLVLFGGAAGSYLIIKNSSSRVSFNLQKETLEKIEQYTKDEEKSPIKWVQDKNPTNNDVSLSSGAAINLTKSISESLFDRMKQSDQQGINPFEDFNPQSPGSQKIIQQTISDFQKQDLFFAVSIDDKDLKISEDNSKEVKIAYFNNIEKIIQVRFGDNEYQRSENQIIKDIENSCLGNVDSSIHQELADLYQNLINDYLNLIVPSEWLDLQKQIIAHFKSSQLVYQAIADCSKDQIKGYLAIEALSQLPINAEKIQNLLAEKWQEIN